MIKCWLAGLLACSLPLALRNRSSNISSANRWTLPTCMRTMVIVASAASSVARSRQWIKNYVYATYSVNYIYTICNVYTGGRTDHVFFLQKRKKNGSFFVCRQYILEMNTASTINVLYRMSVVTSAGTLIAATTAAAAQISLPKLSKVRIQNRLGVPSKGSKTSDPQMHGPRHALIACSPLLSSPLDGKRHHHACLRRHTHVGTVVPSVHVALGGAR